MLINWGLMPGEYCPNDNMIRTTEFGLFNMWLNFLLFLSLTIKWIVLMFYPEHSKVAIYMGEWAQWFGPKIIADFILMLLQLNSLILIAFFYLCLKNPKKMFYWLDYMHFDTKSLIFDKLDLNEIESSKFNKQIKLVWSVIRPSIRIFNLLSFILLLICFYFFEDNYKLLIYYLISFITFIAGHWYFACHWFGLITILFQVFYILI